MEMMPESVGQVSRAWDEQHLDLHAASGQIQGAPTGGFTTAVAGAASRFTGTWERHAESTATRCEEQADGLRATIADWLQTDGRSAGDLARLLTLRGYLTEQR